MTTNTVDEDADRVVYGIVTQRAMRAHFALHELGLPYRTEEVQSRTGQTLTEEYTCLNPRQKIPTLKDGDFVITESAAIITYLGEKYRGRGVELVPEASNNARAILNGFL